MSRRGRPPLGVGEHGSITVTGTPSAGWRARTRLRLSDGRTVQVEGVGTTQRAARAALTARIAWRAKGAGSEGITADTLVPVLLDRWIAWRRDGNGKPVAPRTIDEYADVIRGVLKSRVERLRVGEVTPGTVDTVIQAVLKATPGRARHARTILRQSFAWAVLRGAVATNPVHDLPELEGSSKAAHALTETELTRMRDAIREWEKGYPNRSRDISRVLDLQLATGCRIGEILALRWVDVDLGSTPATVHINATESQDSVSGHRVQEARKGRARKGDIGLTLAIPSWATAMLLEQRVAAGASEFVFPARGGGLRSQGNFRRSLRQALEGTPLEGLVTPHMMRATVATTVADELGVKAASDQLGHRQVAVTERHYIARGRTTVDGAAALEGLGPKPATADAGEASTAQ